MSHAVRSSPNGLPRSLYPLACIVTLLAALPCCGRPGIDDSHVADILNLAASVTQDTHPGATRVVLSETVSCNIDEAGRRGRRIRRLEKPLTDRAAAALGEVRLQWDSVSQELILHTCLTVSPDGEYVTSVLADFEQVSLFGESGCEPFSTLRVARIDLATLAAGGVLELDYEVRDLQPQQLPPGGLEFFQGEWPILSKQLIVSLPPHTTLRWCGVNDAPIPCERKDDPARQTWIWTGENLAELPAEDTHEQYGEYRPYVVFATGGDWSALVMRLRMLTEEAIVVSPDMRSWLRQEQDDQLDELRDLTTRDTVLRIAELVGERLRTIGSPYPHWQRAPRPAPNVFAADCATIWEKGVLALALLREIGLEPELALFSRWEAFADEVASGELLGTMRVVLPLGNDHYWLAPDSGLPAIGACDLTGKTGLFLDTSAQGYRTYTIPAFAGRIELVADIQPNRDGGLTMECDLNASGRFRYEIRNLTVERIAAEVAASVIAGAEVARVRIIEKTSSRLWLRMSAVAPQPQTEHDGTRRLLLPKPPCDVTDTFPAPFGMHPRQRRTPLQLTSALTERIELRMRLPRGLRVTALPPEVELEAAGVHYALHSRLEGDRVTIIREFGAPRGSISPGDYADIRNIVVTAAAPAARTIVLDKE